MNENPWNMPAMDRGKWTTGIDGVSVRFLVDHPEAKAVYWAGCAVEYDERAKKVGAPSSGFFTTRASTLW